ncbi:glycosyltransferase family 4 protein [Providencia rettgeri]
MKKFAIDVRWMVGRYRGMGKYATQLISSIENKMIGFSPKNCEKSRLFDIKSGINFYPLWEQFTLPILAKKNNISFLICPYNTAPLIKPKNTKIILIIHDLIFMKTFAELPISVSPYQTLGRLYRKFIVPRAIKNADYILTVSNFTKKQIINHFDYKLPLYVIPNAVSNDWMNLNVIPLEKRGNYFLTVTGEAPSKNLLRLLLSYIEYTKIIKSPTKLKIVGVKHSQKNKFLNKIASQPNINNIEFLDFISDEELKELYRNAKGFIFASLFEGFGIPLIEAMAVGTPIACSNTSSIPEVVGECAYKFSPTCIDEIKNSFIYLDESFSSNIIKNRVSNGLRRINLFSEENISYQFKQFWKHINEH